MSTHTKHIYIVTYWITDMWGTRFKTDRLIKSEAYEKQDRANLALESWKKEGQEYRFGYIKKVELIK